MRGAQVANMKLSFCSSFASTFKLITLECALESTGELVKNADSESACLEWGLGFCISDRLQDDAKVIPSFEY